MVRKRLDDIAALVTMPSGSEKDQSVSVCVERIDNGFVTKRSQWDGQDYTCKTTYSPARPVVDINVSGNETSEGNSLTEAVRYMRG